MNRYIHGIALLLNSMTTHSQLSILTFNLYSDFIAICIPTLRFQLVVSKIVYYGFKGKRPTDLLIINQLRIVIWE